MEKEENKTDEEKKDFNSRRIKVFFKEKLPVHISLRGGVFYNGYILEPPREKFFFIHDRIEGKQIIFFEELAKPVTEFDNNRRYG